MSLEVCVPGSDGGAIQEEALRPTTSRIGIYICCCLHISYLASRAGGCRIYSDGGSGSLTSLVCNGGSSGVGGVRHSSTDIDTPTAIRSECTNSCSQIIALLIVPLAPGKFGLDGGPQQGLRGGRDPEASRPNLESSSSSISKAIKSTTRCNKISSYPSIESCSLESRPSSWAYSKLHTKTIPSRHTCAA